LPALHLSPRAARFQHVVFAEPRHRRRRQIIDLARSESKRPPPSGRISLRADQQGFVRWLFDQAGLNALHYRDETLRRRLPACLRALRAGTCADARQVLLADPSKVGLAISAMVIGVTSFFRDAAVFDHLTYTVLRELRRQSRGPRIWSAACSDGQELYSVAMLLTEMNMFHDAYLLGTDCRAQTIARARAGRYAGTMLRDVPAPWVEKYFVRTGDAFQIDPEMRRRLYWRRADVTSIIEPGTWDVIFCRNMAMYLRPEVSGRLWQRMEQALRPGGFLVLGKAERPIGAERLGMVAPCIYRRNKG
jgi:chemotaxis methyl-accepting protein methylase